MHTMQHVSDIRRGYGIQQRQRTRRLVEEEVGVGSNLVVDHTAAADYHSMLVEEGLVRILPI